MLIHALSFIRYQRLKCAHHDVLGDCNENLVVGLLQIFSCTALKL
jgi:hypothetical protein